MRWGSFGILVGSTALALFAWGAMAQNVVLPGTATNMHQEQQALKDARRRRDDIRKLVAAGKDPSEHRKAEKAERDEK